MEKRLLEEQLKKAEVSQDKYQVILNTTKGKVQGYFCTMDDEFVKLKRDMRKEDCICEILISRNAIVSVELSDGDDFCY